jgi:HSP20 family protein
MKIGLFFSEGTWFDLIPPKITTMIYAKRLPQTATLPNIFDEFFGSYPTSNPDGVSKSSVQVNIYEGDQGYHLELNVPGRNKEDFKLNVEKDLLTISYEKKNEAENKSLRSIRTEFEFSSFKRSFTLDEKINTDAIEAKYDNGILQVYLPKKEEVKISPKQISVL